MKRTAVTSFFIVFTLLSNIYASEKLITAGINLSQFYDEISKPLPGYSLGFGWEWKIGVSSALIFSPSFLYRGAKLENKTVWDGSDWLRSYNIWYQRGYIDLMFVYQYYLNRYRIYLNLGLSETIAVNDGSSIKLLSEEYLPTHNPDSFDFNINMDPGLLIVNRSLDLVISIGKRFNAFAFGGILRTALVGKEETVHSININSQFITFATIVSWYF